VDLYVAKKGPAAIGGKRQVLLVKTSEDSMHTGPAEAEPRKGGKEEAEPTSRQRSQQQHQNSPPMMPRRERGGVIYREGRAAAAHTSTKKKKKVLLCAPAEGREKETAGGGWGDGGGAAAPGRGRGGKREGREDLHRRRREKGGGRSGVRGAPSGTRKEEGKGSRFFHAHEKGKDFMQVFGPREGSDGERGVKVKDFPGGKGGRKVCKHRDW